MGSEVPSEGLRISDRKKKHKLRIPKPTMILTEILSVHHQGIRLYQIQVFAPQVDHLKAVMMPNWPVICGGWRRRWNSVQQPVMVRLGQGVRGFKRSLDLGSRVVSFFYCVLQANISRLSIRYAKFGNNQKRI